VEGLSGPLFSIKGVKYPYWAGGHLFGMDEDRLAVTAYGTSGQSLWTKHFSNLVSAMDSNGVLTAVGTLDGRVQVFDSRGNSSGPFVPGGSRLPVIYNVALSPDGTRLLVLAGVDPKRFLILEKGGADFRPVFHKPLAENKPWPTWLGFVDAGSQSYHETESSLVLTSATNTSQVSELPFSGTLEAVHFLPDRKLVLLLSVRGTQQTLQIDSLDGHTVLKVGFAAKDVLVVPSADHLMLAIDQSLVGLHLRYE
jgi:WD40 repeat protein